MPDLNTTVTLEECLETLNKNKSHYDSIKMQIYLVGQLFGMSYSDVVKTMRKID